MNPQLRKAAPLILVALLASLLFIVRRCKDERPIKAKTTVTNNNTKQKNEPVIDRDKGFDRRISYLEYSNHAKCRMRCRKISQAEIEEIMQNGEINYNKSDIQSRSQSGSRCPRYAVEGITDDNQEVRIVFAQCNEKTVVVTVIDLDREWSCSCPGDDKKYDNKN